MTDKLAELKARLSEIDDLNRVTDVLYWDQATYLPPEGGEGRGRQIATLTSLAHARLTDPALSHLLEELRPLEDKLHAQDKDSDDAALIRVSRRDVARATRVPTALVAELRRHQSNFYDLWTRARPGNDFASVRPMLEKTVELSRRYARCFDHEHLADPMIEEADYGMKATSVRALFSRLRAELVPIVKTLASRPLPDNACLTKSFPEAGQLAFGDEVIRKIGYDMTRGRVDKTHHPFMIRFSSGDVRITTRIKEHDLGECLFSMIHEAGHAMYEQGIAGGLAGGPLQSGTSAGVHESQSRLWENVVGRSAEFWKYFFPRLVTYFPTQLAGVTEDEFVAAINRVEPTLIRTDADEVTYNLHVMMRFDFELDLLDGKLAVKDLPEAWRARFQTDLGVSSPAGDDKDGCLQDMHWFTGVVGGAFQGYTIGNIFSAQAYASALKAHPGIPGEIAGGEFGTLRRWLTENLYRHGRKLTAPEAIERATGSPLTIEPYIAYLRSKYKA